MKPLNHKEYFMNLLRNLQEHNQQQGLTQMSYNQISKSSKKCIQKAYNSILYGVIELKQKPDLISLIQKQSQPQNTSNQITQIDQKIKQNQQILKQAKRQMLVYKRQQKEAMKLENQIKARENQQKIKEWSEKQRIYNEKRQKLFQQRERAIQEEEERLKQQREEQRQLQIEEKRKSLQKKAILMQEQRQQRRQMFQRTVQQSKRIAKPKFKKIQNQFKNFLAEKDFESQVIKKSIKLSHKLDFEEIKEHQKQYKEKIQERMRQKGYSSLNSMEQKRLHQAQFNNLLGRNTQQIKQQKQKFKRRLEYQSRLSQIQLNLDESKRLQFEIARDKTKYPLKYHFLRQKNLNDQQIYLEFKDFFLDIDRKSLGNQYLADSKKIAEQSRIRKSQSVSAITLKEKDKPRYQNYLPQIRSTYNSSQNINNFLDPQVTIKETLRKQSNPDKAIDKISISLKKYDDSIENKKMELKSLNTISSTLKKEKQIDQMYIKSLKAKLACLQIQQ